MESEHERGWKSIVFSGMLHESHLSVSDITGEFYSDLATMGCRQSREVVGLRATTMNENPTKLPNVKLDPGCFGPRGVHPVNPPSISY